MPVHIKSGLLVSLGDLRRKSKLVAGVQSQLTDF